MPRMSAEHPTTRAQGAFHPRPSAPAIALTALMVFGAVLFGIYGPPVAGRLSHAGGVPLADVLADAAEPRAREIVQAMQESDQPDLHPEEARAAVRRLTNRTVRVPSLDEMGYRLRRVGPVNLSGAVYRGAAITYRGTDDASGHWLVIFVAADDGQFLSYDSLGRPRPLAPDLALEGEIATALGEPVVAVVWSDSPVLWIASFDDAAEAARMREAVGAP